MAGEWIVVGASGDDEMCTVTPDCNAGAAYVFRFNGVLWFQVQKLTPSLPDAGDRIGFSAAIDGDVLVLGAIRDDEFGEDAGAAYVFSASGNCPIPAECNEDGVVDLYDFLELYLCKFQVSKSCLCMDLNGSGGPDLIDFGLFQLAFSHFGP